jgi:hypothetical protein
MVGELDVSIADQPLTIEFLGDTILFKMKSLRSAAAVARIPSPDLKPLGKLLAFGQMKVAAKVGDRRPIELFPQPGWLVKIIAPRFRDMASQA